MVDVFTREKRSEVMARIRGKGNKKTEQVFVQLLRSEGITGWRRHLPKFGNPDFCFPKQRIAIFVDGCFWHGCPKHYNVPANNAEFWAKKLKANTERDSRVNIELQRQGWKVMRFWEHDLRDHPERCLKIVQRNLNSYPRLPAK